MLKRVVPKRAVLRRARAGPGRAARLATYSMEVVHDYTLVGPMPARAALGYIIAQS